MSGSAPAFRHCVNARADQVWKNVVTYWADVLQLWMNSGGIRQKGGRVSEKDGEIGMCVVVHAAGVGRCQRDSKGYLDSILICGKLKVQKWARLVSRARGCNEVDTPVRSRSRRSRSLPFEATNEPRINSRQQHNHPRPFSLSPTSAPFHLIVISSNLKNFSQIFTTSPLPCPRQIYRT